MAFEDPNIFLSQWKENWTSVHSTWGWMDGLLRSQTVTSTNNCVQKATMASPLGHDQIKPMMYLCYTTEQTGLRRAEVKLISGLRSLLRYIMTSSCHHVLQQSFYVEMFPVCWLYEEGLLFRFFFPCLSTGLKLLPVLFISSYGCLWFTYLHKLPAPD